MLGTVWLITASFLCCARFVAVFGLAALLVAKFKADPELSHVAARENVWDPVNHKRAGLLLICCSCSRNSSVNMAVQADFRCKRRKTKERKVTHRLWGRCGAPLVVSPAADLTCILLVIPTQAEARGSENVSTNRLHFSQNSEWPPAAAVGQDKKKEVRSCKKRSGVCQKNH